MRLVIVTIYSKLFTTGKII